MVLKKAKNKRNRLTLEDYREVFQDLSQLRGKKYRYYGIKKKRRKKMICPRRKQEIEGISKYILICNNKKRAYPCFNCGLMVIKKIQPKFFF